MIKIDMIKMGTATEGTGGGRTCYFAYGSNMDPIQFKKCVRGQKDVERAHGELEGLLMFF